MSEENNNAKMSEAESTADKAKKLSEDARGLGPGQVGLITISVVDMMVGNSGVGARLRGHGKTKRYWATEIIDLDFTFFLYGFKGSSEWRTGEFANRRLNTEYGGDKQGVSPGNPQFSVSPERSHWERVLYRTDSAVRLRDTIGSMGSLPVGECAPETHFLHRLMLRTWSEFLSNPPKAAAAGDVLDGFV
jgi:hypothetical protein